MRRIAIAAVFTTATLVFHVVGCTFLVSFDDQPGVDASVATADRVTPSVDAARTPDPEPAIDATPGPADEKCDLEIDRTLVKGCASYEENGIVCADGTGLTQYPPSDRQKDVVTCSKTKGAICIRHCVIACAHLPAGFPDQCDDCGGKADKLYCGIEMKGWPTAEFGLLVRCMGGRLVEGEPGAGGPKNCGKGCKPSATGDATCL